MMTQKQFQALPDEVYKPAFRAMSDVDHDLEKLAILTCILLCGIGTARELGEYMECHMYSGRY